MKIRNQIKIPKFIGEEGVVLKLLDSRAHTCPLAKIQYSKGIFYGKKEEI